MANLRYVISCRDVYAIKANGSAVEFVAVCVRVGFVFAQSR
jgi:hypothetical protein